MNDMAPRLQRGVDRSRGKARALREAGTRGVVVPHRGQRCEPAYALHTARCIAEARSESLEVFSAHTENTVQSFFGLEK